MTFPSHKICASCEGEFRGHVERCPDCGIPLTWPDPPQEPVIPEPPMEEMPVPEGYALGVEDVPENEGLAHLGISGEPDEVRDISVLLSRERLRHWLIPQNVKDVLAVYNKPSDYMDVYVLPEDLDQAAEIMRRHLWVDAPEGLDMAAVLADITACPACSTPIPSEDITECPECGLVLGD